MAATKRTHEQTQPRGLAKLTRSPPSHRVRSSRTLRCRSTLRRRRARPAPPARRGLTAEAARPGMPAAKSARADSDQGGGRSLSPCTGDCTLDLRPVRPRRPTSAPASRSGRSSRSPRPKAASAPTSRCSARTPGSGLPRCRLRSEPELETIRASGRATPAPRSIRARSRCSAAVRSRSTCSTSAATRRS